MTAFEEMGIIPEIARAVEDMEWMLPTDIQNEAIPLILGGGDVLMAAETGSGKTGAFCLPVLQIVWETLDEKSGGKKKSNQSAPDWHLSFRDRQDGLMLSAEYTKCQTHSPQWLGVRCNRGLMCDRKFGGRYYYEVLFEQNGLARIGWSTANANLNLGTCKNGFGFGSTAKKSNANNFEDYGTTFGQRGDRVGTVLDFDAGTISWFKNDEFLGEGFRLPQNILSQPLFPTITNKNAIINFLATPDDHSKIPPNCKWISQAPEQIVITNSNESAAAKLTPSKTGGAGEPKAVIIEPSRELAEQTYNCLDKFKKHLPLEVKLVLLCGGGNAKDQTTLLKAGVDIVVATPGRLEDLVLNNFLSLKQCRFFILDEVDGLLQQGHGELINKLHVQIPRMTDDGKRLQMIVCSATLHNFDVKKLAEKMMYFPTWIDLKGEDSVPETVHHVVFRVDPRKDLLWKSLKGPITTDGVHLRDKLNPNQPNAETLSEAVKLLKGYYTLKAIDSLNIGHAIIFCRTKIDCDNMERYLEQASRLRGQKDYYSCVCLHGDRKPQERKANLERFKNGQCKFLICTDVAARGIDIKGVPFVIQVTLPDEKANYIHRIGRVGRAERMGLAVSLVSEVPEKVWFHSNCNRNKNCANTNLTEQGGCCIWYNELRLLAEIEESLNTIISTIEDDFKLEVNEFDGKVVYGAKRDSSSKFKYETHVDQLKDVVKNLSQLEAQAQSNFLRMFYIKA